MSSVAIISIIVVLIVALVSYASISQTITARRKQKQRLLAALKFRSKDFKYMIAGFPPDFLSKDLNVLVYRCLIDVLEQLSKLDPQEKLYIDELILFKKQYEEAQSKPKIASRKQLDNPQQTKEIKRLLQGLNQFIGNLLKRGSITNGQSKEYNEQIKSMVIQVTVDNYIMNAKQSKGSGKTRLAIHYFSLAKKLLEKESGKQNFIKQIQQLDGVIAQLEAQAAEEDPGETANAIAAKTSDESNKWDEFKQDDSEWKKKSVYD